MPRRIDVDGLFQATLTVLTECGYRATTTREIANRAGVNEVTLFRRYGDKATLINTALTYALGKSPLVRFEGCGDLTEDLLALVRAYRDTTGKYGGAVAALFVDIQRHPELQRTMTAVVPMMRNLTDVFAGYQDRGQLTPGNPMDKMLRLFSPLMISGMWERTGTELESTDSELPPELELRSIVTESDLRALVAAFLDGNRVSPDG